jgi:hypothetical protein
VRPGATVRGRWLTGRLQVPVDCNLVQFSRSNGDKLLTSR